MGREHVWNAARLTINVLVVLDLVRQREARPEMVARADRRPVEPGEMTKLRTLDAARPYQLPSASCFFDGFFISRQSVCRLAPLF